jgi:hypothetical protein
MMYNNTADLNLVDLSCFLEELIVTNEGHLKWYVQNMSLYITDSLLMVPVP